MPCAIVERMAVLDEDFGTDLTLVADNGGGPVVPRVRAGEHAARLALAV